MNVHELIESIYFPTLAQTQAKLVLADWQMKLIDDLPAEERANALELIDAIASQHGLTTPTQIIVFKENA